MNTIKNIFISLFLLLSIVSCTAQTKESAQTNTIAINKIEVYYFHYTRRCATCNSIEKETKTALENLYPEKFKNGTITFQSINLDDESSKEIAEKFSVSEQSLIIVKGDNKKDITNEGFMFARTTPVKLKEKIKSEIDKLTN